MARCAKDRPALELANIVGAARRSFVKRSRHWLNWQHFKVLVAIERCRTAALGGHIDECTRCGHQTTISFNSCRNRHCPKCQANARDRWLEARRQELLPTRYVHGVFTLPHLLAPLALQNKKLIYGLLFRTSADTLLEVARNPQRLGAEIGFFSVLHSWNQKLESEAGISSVSPLHRCRRRAVAGPHAMDPPSLSLLASGRGAQPCLPRQVCRRTETCPRPGRSQLPREAAVSG